jgi:hypothetical protein
MVTITNGVPESDIIGNFESLSECYFNITKQEMYYDLDTLNQDWLCVRTEGEWPFEFRY